MSPLASPIFSSINSVLSVGEQGFLEGRCQDRQGWFPSNVVQDIHVFSEFIVLLNRLAKCRSIELIHRKQRS